MEETKCFFCGDVAAEEDWAETDKALCGKCGPAYRRRGIDVRSAHGCQFHPCAVCGLPTDVSAEGVWTCHPAKGSHPYPPEAIERWRGR